MVVGATRIEKKGDLRDGKLRVEDTAPMRKVWTRPFPEPARCSINWSLFEAVQRLPRKAGESLSFTLLDDFDQARPNQTLSFWKTAQTRVGGRRVQRSRVRQLEKGRVHNPYWAIEDQIPVRLHGFSHTGDGVVPWVYWVDDAGRLLCAVSGIEAYLYEGEGEG